MIALTKIVAVLLVFAFIQSTLHKVNLYEESRYDGGANTDGIDVHAFFLQAKEDCNQEKSATAKDGCHESVDRVIKRHVDTRDLIAQETVALATRGLLWMAAIQAITSFLTLGFLGWTVYQTYSILDQSVATTKAAELTLEQSSKSAEATRISVSHAINTTVREQRAYISIDRVKVIPLKQLSNNSLGFSHQVMVQVKFRNSGKTPASINEFLSVDEFYFRHRGKDYRQRDQNSFTSHPDRVGVVMPGTTANTHITFRVVETEEKIEGPKNDGFFRLVADVWYKDFSTGDDARIAKFIAGQMVGMKNSSGLDPQEINKVRCRVISDDTGEVPKDLGWESTENHRKIKKA